VVRETAGAERLSAKLDAVRAAVAARMISVFIMSTWF
jgi:hypothetical protein